LTQCCRSHRTRTIDIVRLLIEIGADLNKEGPYGSALWSTVNRAVFSKEHLDILQLLLRAGIDTKAGEDGHAALWVAQRGNKELTQLLIDAGVDRTYIVVKGRMLIDFVSEHCTNNKQEIIDLLTKNQKIAQKFGIKYFKKTYKINNQVHHSSDFP